MISAGSGSSMELMSPREEQPPGMILLRKKSDDDAMFGGIVRPKTSKRSKRDKRRSFVSYTLFMSYDWLLDTCNTIGTPAPAN